jgi:hypothetical protein
MIFGEAFLREVLRALLILILALAAFVALIKTFSEREDHCLCADGTDSRMEHRLDKGLSPLRGAVRNSRRRSVALPRLRRLPMDAVAYVRISSKAQGLAMQKAAIETAACPSATGTR